MNAFTTHLLVQTLPPLVMGAFAALLGVRAVREVGRRLPPTDDVHPRIARLRADSSWPGLRRGARGAAVLATVALLGGASWAAIAALLGGVVNMVIELRGALALLVATPVTLAVATAVAWAAEQLLHLTLDFLDAALLRVAPQGRAESPPTDRAPLE